jgi:hypothetical protein
VSFDDIHPNMRLYPTVSVDAEGALNCFDVVSFDERDILAEKVAGEELALATLQVAAENSVCRRLMLFWIMRAAFDALCTVATWASPSASSTPF